MTPKDNLIPINLRTKEEALKIQIKGGMAKSEAKTLANGFKNLKHGRYARKFTLMVRELAQNPQTSALKIFQLIEQIGADWANLDYKLRMELARLYCEAHKTIHGTKQLNLNLNTDLKEDLERWFAEKEKDGDHKQA